MIHDPCEIEEWLQEMEEQIDEGGRSFTEWEEEFIASIREQFDRKQTLSDKQEEVLERIYRG